MKNINRVVISGNMTREPDLRRTQSGMAILTIGVACNDSRKNQQTGEWEDIANFVDCTMFGNRAESIAQYLHKGTKVLIEGKLRYSSWQDKETGKNRSKLEVLIDEIEFNNPPQQSGQQGGYQQPKQPQVQHGHYAPPQPQQYGQPMPQQAPHQPPMQQQYVQPAQQPYQPQPAPQPAQQQPAQQQPAPSVYDEDIPF